MKITTKYEDTMNRDCQVQLTTAGVLGEVFVDVDCRQAKGGPLQTGDELPTRDVPQLQDVVRASQGTLQNVDTLVKRLDSILSYIQSGQGSIGKVIYDPSLFNRANDMLSQLQQVVTQVNSPKGTIGKLINSDELYNKANAAVDNLNKIIDEVEWRQGHDRQVPQGPARCMTTPTRRDHPGQRIDRAASMPAKAPWASLPRTKNWHARSTAPSPA